MKKNNQYQRNKGRKFETRLQKTIGSGIFWFDKGDLKDKDYLVESKYTDKAGFRVSSSLLEKLWNQALTTNKEPRLILGIKRNEKEIFIVTCQVTLERKLS